MRRQKERHRAVLFRRLSNPGLLKYFNLLTTNLGLGGKRADYRRALCSRAGERSFQELPISRRASLSFLRKLDSRILGFFIPTIRKLSTTPNRLISPLS